MKGWILLLLSISTGIISAAPSGKVENVILCELCHVVVKEVKHMIAENKTQDDIVNYLNDICSRLPEADQDLCKHFVNGHSGDTFVKVIQELDPNKVCSMLEGVCPDKQTELQGVEPEFFALKAPPHEGPKHVGGALECEICRLAVVGVDRLIGSNRSQGAINSTLEKICKSLPGELGDICQKEEGKIVEALSQGFNPTTACTFVKLCGASAEDPISHIPCDVCHSILSPAGVEVSDGVCSHFKTCQVEKPHKDLIQPDDTPECELCKFVMTVMDDLLGSNRSAAAINSTLMYICNSAPGELQAFCLSLEPRLLALLNRTDADPVKVCTEEKLCAAGTARAIDAAYIPCDLCQSTLKGLLGEKGIDMCFDIPNICLEAGIPVEETQLNHGKKEQENFDCDLCQFIMKSVEDLLQEDKSDAAVNNALNSICPLMPNKASREFCEDQGHNIVSMLLEGVADHRDGCSMLQLCQKMDEKPVGNSRKPELVEVPLNTEPLMMEPGPVEVPPPEGSKELPEEAVGPKADPVECAVCKFIIGYIDQQIGQNKSQAAINATLFKLCDELGPGFSSICDALIPQIGKILGNGSDPQASCVAVNFCSNSAVGKEWFSCSTCVEVMDIIKVSEEVADKLCSHPCQKKQNVKTEADANTQEILPLESMEPGPVEVPEIEQEPHHPEPVELPEPEEEPLQLEPGPVEVPQEEKEEEEPEPVEEPVNTEPLLLEPGPVEIAPQEEETEKPEAAVRPKQNVVECTICKLIVVFIDREVGTNKSQAAINSTLYKLCADLGPGFKTICDTLIPQIEKLVKNGLDPNTSCTAVKLCSSEALSLDWLTCSTCHEIMDITKVSEEMTEMLCSLPCDRRKRREISELDEIKEISTVLEKAPKVGGAIECDLCKFLVKEVDQYLEENSSMAFINSTVFRICDYLPVRNWTLTCLALAPQIVLELKNGLPAEKVCDTVKACSAKSSLRNIKKMISQAEGIVTGKEETGLLPVLHVGRTLECDVCEFLVDQLDQILEENRTTAAINSTIYKICAELPLNLSAPCEKEAPALVAELANGFPPQIACVDIKMCKPNETKIEEKAELITDLVTTTAEPVKCELCMKLMQAVDDDLTHDYTRIRAFIMDICNKLPDPTNNAIPSGIKAKCLYVAENLIPLLLNTILIPGVFCLNVDACPDDIQAPVSWPGEY